MNSKKQQGFTLIELIIVIVILGILAVSASPRFLDLTSDARQSSVNGLLGAVQGAANIVYSKALIDGEAAGEDQALTNVAGVTANFGYPRADIGSIQIAAGLTTNDWVFDQDDADAEDATEVRIYPIGNFANNSATNTANDFTDDRCYVSYTETDTAGTPPVIVAVTANCQ